MELTMSTRTDARLITFNNLAVRFQDEAYTLAYYLLGDENRAAETTQDAFARLYQRAGLRLDKFRLEIFRWVLAHAHSRSGVLSRATARDELSRDLLRLNERERSVVVLIDVMGLSYDEAAEVLDCSKKQVGQLLALARIHFSHSTQAVH